MLFIIFEINTTNQKIKNNLFKIYLMLSHNNTSISPSILSITFLKAETG